MEDSASSVEQIVDQVLELPELQRPANSSSHYRREKGQHQSIIEKSKKTAMFGSELTVKSMMWQGPDYLKANSTRLKWGRGGPDRDQRSRLFDSIEAALRIADGYVVIDTMDGKELLFSERLCCQSVALPFEWRPRLFFFPMRLCLVEWLVD